MLWRISPATSTGFSRIVPNWFCFFGSTIGNLDELESRSFLKGIARILNSGDRFLLGLDMLKPVHILEAAYNDSQNVTAEFNKNILLVLNRELGANFRTDDFDHLAFFNESLERMEMHLQSPTQDSGRNTDGSNFPSPLSRGRLFKQKFAGNSADRAQRR